jgi:hypothetical protein
MLSINVNITLVVALFGVFVKVMLALVEVFFADFDVLLAHSQPPGFSGPEGFDDLQEVEASSRCLSNRLADTVGQDVKLFSGFHGLSKFGHLLGKLIDGIRMREKSLIGQIFDGHENR